MSRDQANDTVDEFVPDFFSSTITCCVPKDILALNQLSLRPPGSLIPPKPPSGNTIEQREQFVWKE
jgi:hypothetical protein